MAGVERRDKLISRQDIAEKCGLKVLNTIKRRLQRFGYITGTVTRKEVK